MDLIRTLATSVFAAALLGPALPASGSPDPTYPTGTFTLLSTAGYLQDNPAAGGDDEVYANFEVVVTALSDDTTPMQDITITPDPQDEWWGPEVYHVSSLPDRVSVTYREYGTFSPAMILTDKDGNSTRIELGEVTVMSDRTPPTFTLTKPWHVHRIAGWHRIVGTYQDDGVGLDGVTLNILQRRHGVWYYYGYCCAPYRWSWHRGNRTVAATLKGRGGTSTYGLDTLSDQPGHWSTRRISHLTRGRLVLIARASDSNANESAPKRYSVRLTRR